MAAKKVQNTVHRSTEIHNKRGSLLLLKSEVRRRKIGTRCTRSVEITGIAARSFIKIVLIRMEYILYSGSELQTEPLKIKVVSYLCSKLKEVRTLYQYIRLTVHLRKQMGNVHPPGIIAVQSYGAGFNRHIGSYIVAVDLGLTQ